MDFADLQHLAVSLGLGLLVGFQREWSSPHVAGVRTFALITLLGTATALLSRPLGGWVVAAGLLGVALIVLVGAAARMSRAAGETGLTTPVAALVMFVVGALLVFNGTLVGVFLGATVAVLLHWKEPLHAFIERLGEPEVRGIIQLVLIALIILPLLPDVTYGPYGVLNPFEIWLIVVLICGISLTGYITYKFLGATAGTLLGGFLGGLISSTATTVSFARRTSDAPAAAPNAALVILIASTVVFLRVIAEVVIFARDAAFELMPPILIMMGYMALLCGGFYLKQRRETAQIPLEGDPAQLRAAIMFGLLYAVVLFAVAATRHTFGDRGLYVVAAISGLTDMDAITISTSRLVQAGEIQIDTGWRMILIGAMSNLVLKNIVVALLGHQELTRRITLAVALAVIGGLVIMGSY